MEALGPMPSQYVAEASGTRPSSASGLGLSLNKPLNYICMGLGRKRV